MSVNFNNNDISVCSVTKYFTEHYSKNAILKITYLLRYNNYMLYKIQVNIFRNSE